MGINGVRREKVKQRFRKKQQFQEWEWKRYIKKTPLDSMQSNSSRLLTNNAKDNIWIGQSNFPQ